MATAAEWLNELGTPPPDICRDWSWQLRSYCSQRSVSEQCEDPPLDLRALTWEDIEVAETGLLSLNLATSLSSSESLIQQLQAWSEAGEARDPSVSLTEPSSESLVEAAFLPHKLSGVKSSKSGIRATKSVLPLLTLIKRHRLLAIVSGLIVAVSFSWLAFQAVNSNSASSDSLSSKTDAEHSVASETSPDAVSAEDLSIADMAPLPTMEDVLGSQSNSLNIPSVERMQVNLAGVVQAGANSVASLTPLDANSTEASAIDAKPIEVQGATETQVASVASEIVVSETAADRDVMRDIAALTKKAEGQETETELPATQVKPESKSMLEPLVLKTSPMIQTHTLPGALARPREPVWSILISVDDDFEIEPKDAQRISGRQSATWLLSTSDAKSPATKLVIQVQPAPGRQAGLRWRIAASAEDMPAMALPVAKDSLRFLQNRLQGYVELMRAESSRLSVLSKSAEPEVRSLISKQRAALESQSKLASRVASVVTEALLLDELLRSQVTLYAELYDGDKSTSPLLQFGDRQQLLESPKEESADVE